MTIDLTAALAPIVAQMPPLLQMGGPVLWLIAGLSVFALALSLWKLWRLSWLGAWRRNRADRAIGLWRDDRPAEALSLAKSDDSAIARVVATAIAAADAKDMTEAAAREETERVAKEELSRLRSGLRALETVVTVAPLLGLLGTVLGMIDAFQALQETGARADPAALAGGIWEALLTTAAGMAVAIPAGIALTYFESVIDRVRLRMETSAARIFARPLAAG